MSAQQPSPPGDALRQAPPTPTPHIGEHMCLVMWPWGCQILQALNRKPTQELGCFLRKSYINCNHRVPCIHSTYLDEPALLWDFPEAQNRKRPRKQFPTKKNHRECHLGEYLISAAQDLPTSSTPASSPQSRSSGNKFVSHTFNKAEKNKNWNSFSPLTKWRKEEMKISTGARQLWTVSGALWWKKPGEFSIKFFFCIFLNKLESRSTFVLIVCQDWFFFTRDAGFAGLPGLPASDDPKLPDSANLTSGLNSGPWPVHYKSSKNGSYADMWT